MKLTINSGSIGRTYYKFTIGWQIINLPLSLLGWGTFAKVWQTTFEFYHIPFNLVLFGFPVLMAFMGFLIGDQMIKKKVQAEMQSLVNIEANPQFVRQCKQLNAITKHLGIVVEE